MKEHTRKRVASNGGTQTFNKEQRRCQTIHKEMHSQGFFVYWCARFLALFLPQRTVSSRCSPSHVDQDESAQFGVLARYLKLLVTPVLANWMKPPRRAYGRVTDSIHSSIRAAIRKLFEYMFLRSLAHANARRCALSMDLAIRWIES